MSNRTESSAAHYRSWKFGAGFRARTFLVRLWQLRTLRWSVLLLPSILAGIYFSLIAADQYESEAYFVVRSSARPEMSGGLSLLVHLGLARSQDDSFIIQEYITSRDAIDRLKHRLPLLAMFSPPEADFLARYPSMLYGLEDEEFYRYFQHMVSVVHTDKTGITALRVRSFRATDAYEIAQTLLVLGEELVNRINRRLQSDAISNSLAELDAAQRRLVAAQTEMTEFRNRELTIDPVRNAVALGELIARLSAELAVVQAHIAETKTGSASSPQLVGLQRKAAALEQQIAEERRRITDDKEGLAPRIAAYERLTLEREFARRMLTASETELARSRQEASRQLLYLERVVEPNLADYPTQPKRARWIASIFMANILLVFIGWLVLAGIREHASHGQ